MRYGMVGKRVLIGMSSAMLVVLFVFSCKVQTDTSEVRRVEPVAPPPKGSKREKLEDLCSIASYKGYDKLDKSDNIGIIGYNWSGYGNVGDKKKSKLYSYYLSGIHLTKSYYCSQSVYFSKGAIDYMVEKNFICEYRVNEGFYMETIENVSGKIFTQEIHTKCDDKYLVFVVDGKAGKEKFVLYSVKQESKQGAVPNSDRYGTYHDVEKFETASNGVWFFDKPLTYAIIE